MTEPSTSETAPDESPRKRTLIAALAATRVYHWHIFPAPPDEKMSYKSEKYSGRKWGMTNDPAEVKADFARWPLARIGIPTGIINGFVVIETDTIEGHGVDGMIGFRELEAKYGPLPDRTRKVMSPSGSVHRYFQHPGRGIKIVGSNGALAPGVDVKGDLQMVIGAGSVNADGRAYRLIDDSPIAPLPDAWVELLREKPPKRLSIRERATAAVRAHELVRMIQSGGISRYVAGALRGEVAKLSAASDGHRNEALNKSTFALARFALPGLLSCAEIERALTEACVANGLMFDRENGGPKKIAATIRSAFKGRGL
jgi:Bifunctional DNA primase/polymerase, N-terminal